MTVGRSRLGICWCNATNSELRVREITHPTVNHGGSTSTANLPGAPPIHVSLGYSNNILHGRPCHPHHGCDAPKNAAAKSRALAARTVLSDNCANTGPRLGALYQNLQIRLTDGELSLPQIVNLTSKGAPQSCGARFRKGMTMDKDRVAGSAKVMKGKVKSAVGKVTGDAKMNAEGKADQVKGKVQNAIGGAKDALKGK